MDLIHTHESLLFLDLYTIIPNDGKELLDALSFWSQEAMPSVLISQDFSLFSPTVFVRRSYTGIRFVSLWKNWLQNCVEQSSPSPPNGHGHDSTNIPRCPRPLRFSLILTIIQSTRNFYHFDTEIDTSLRGKFLLPSSKYKSTSASKGKKHADYFNNVYIEFSSCLKQIKSDYTYQMSKLGAKSNDSSSVKEGPLFDIIPSSSSSDMFTSSSSTSSTSQSSYSEWSLSIEEQSTGWNFYQITKPTGNVSLIHISPTPARKNKDHSLLKSPLSHLRVEKNATLARIQLSVAVMKMYKYPVQSSSSSYMMNGATSESDNKRSGSLEERCISYNRTNNNNQHTDVDNIRGNSSSALAIDRTNNNNNDMMMYNISSDVIDFGDSIDIEYMYADDDDYAEASSNEKKVVTTSNGKKGNAIEIKKGYNNKIISEHNDPHNHRVRISDGGDYVKDDAITGKNSFVDSIAGGHQQSSVEIFVIQYYDFIVFVLYWLTIILSFAIFVTFLAVYRLSTTSSRRNVAYRSLSTGEGLGDNGTGDNTDFDEFFGDEYEFERAQEMAEMDSRRTNNNNSDISDDLFSSRQHVKGDEASFVKALEMAQKESENFRVKLGTAEGASSFYPSCR